MSKRKVTYILNGIEGIAAIAKAHKINPSTMRNRLYRGLTLQEAVKPVVKPGTKTKKASTVKPKAQVGIRFPDRLPKPWRMALGVAR